MRISEIRSVTDPVLWLPSEVLIVVLQYLKFRDLIHAARVSKLWNRLIVETTELWRRIDLTHGTHRPILTTKTLEKYISRGEHKTTHLVLRGLRSPDSAIDLVSKHCSNIEYLGIGQDIFSSYETLSSFISLCTSLTTLRIAKSVPLETSEAQEIMQSCKQLLTAEFHSVKSSISEWPMEPSQNLRRLLIRWKDEPWSIMINHWDDYDLSMLLIQTPNIEELYLSTFNIDAYAPLSRLKNLRSVNIPGNSKAMPAAVLLNLPPTIQELFLGMIDFGDGSPVLELKSRLPDLRSLWITSVTFKYAKQLSILFEANPGGLQEFVCEEFLLSLAEVLAFKAELVSVFKIPHLFAKLRRLTIRGQAVTDSVLKAVAQNCPELVIADFCTSAVTERGLYLILAKPGKKLTRLRIASCDRLQKDVEHRMWVKHRVRFENLDTVPPPFNSASRYHF